MKLLVTLKKKKAIKKNKIAGRSNREERMKGANRDIFEVRFFDWRIIKCNWQKKKKKNSKSISKQKKTPPSKENAKAFKP